MKELLEALSMLVCLILFAIVCIPILIVCFIEEEIEMALS